MYIPKVVDKTNDFWKALILGAKMAAQGVQCRDRVSRRRPKKMTWSVRMNF